MNLIEIYHADDNDPPLKFKQFIQALLNYFGITVPRKQYGDVDVSSGIAALRQFVSYQPSSSDCYSPATNFDEVLRHLQSDELADMIFVDMRWEGTGDTAGEQLIQAVFGRHLHPEVFTNTAYGERLLSEIADVARNFNVIPIPNDPSVDDLKRTLVPAFERIASRYLQQATPEERTKIHNILDQTAENEITEAEITIQQKVWKVKHFFLCCWDADTKSYKNVKKTIGRLITLNLMIEASRALGVDGIKQATHKDRRYYTGSDRWYRKMLEQLSKLEQKVTDVIELLARGTPHIELPYLSKYLDLIRTFRHKAEEIGDKDDDESIEVRERERTSNFRFGTSAKSTPIQIGSYKVTSKEKIGGNEFEIYLAIHKVYENEFLALMNQENVYIRCHSFKTVEKRLHPKTWGSAEYQPALYKEYLLFEQLGEDDYAIDIPKDRLPDFLKVFRAKRFDIFGGLYFVPRRSPLKTYDCTYWPTYFEGSPDVFDDILRNYLCQRLSEGTKAFFIFEFLGWRQP